MRRKYSEEFHLYFHFGNGARSFIFVLFISSFIYGTVNKFLYFCVHEFMFVYSLWSMVCVVCVDGIFRLREERSILLYKRLTVLCKTCGWRHLWCSLAICRAFVGGKLCSITKEWNAAIEQCTLQEHQLRPNYVRAKMLAVELCTDKKSFIHIRICG